MSDFATYIHALPEPERAEFERIRALVHDVVPGVEETFSYGMPAFKYKSKPLLYVGSFKDHMSLFPTAGPIAELEKRIQPFKAAKGTLQFTVDRPIPDTLLTDIVLARVRQIEQS